MKSVSKPAKKKPSNSVPFAFALQRRIISTIRNAINYRVCIRVRCTQTIPDWFWQTILALLTIRLSWIGGKNCPTHKNGKYPSLPIFAAYRCLLWKMLAYQLLCQFRLFGSFSSVKCVLIQRQERKTMISLWKLPRYNR